MKRIITSILITVGLTACTPTIGTHIVTNDAHIGLGTHKPAPVVQQRKKPAPVTTPAPAAAPTPGPTETTVPSVPTSAPTPAAPTVTDRRQPAPAPTPAAPTTVAEPPTTTAPPQRYIVSQGCSYFSYLNPADHSTPIQCTAQDVEWSDGTIDHYGCGLRDMFRGCVEFVFLYSNKRA